MPEFSSTLSAILPETYLCLWKIDEPTEFFEQLPMEWPAVKTNHSIKHLESLAARFCLLGLCERLGIENTLFAQDERERPYFVDSEWKISLTHSFPYIAAACSLTKEIGIDIEKKGRKIEKIAPRFLNPTEYKELKDHPVNLTLAWSIKESIYKAANMPGLSLRDAIVLKSDGATMSGKATLLGTEKSASYYWEEFDEFVLSLARID